MIMRIEANKKDYYSYKIDSFFALAALQQQISNLFVDVELLNASIFWRTNKERLKYNLPQFNYHRKLNEMATMHSEQMRIHNFFAHENSFDAKYRTLNDRLNAVKDECFYGFNCYAENIADIPIIETNVQLVIEKRHGVAHFFKINGTEIFPYTYLEYANIVVNAWMNSPGHRANILNCDYIHLGCGCAKYIKADSGCSILNFKLTQNFGGKELFTPSKCGIIGVKETLRAIKKKL